VVRMAAGAVPVRMAFSSTEVVVEEPRENGTPYVLFAAIYDAN
jgi:hypothetical protein